VKMAWESGLPTSIFSPWISQLCVNNEAFDCLGPGGQLLKSIQIFLVDKLCKLAIGRQSATQSSVSCLKLHDYANTGQRKDIQPAFLTVPVETNPEVIPRENGFDTHRPHSPAVRSGPDAYSLYELLLMALLFGCNETRFSEGSSLFGTLKTGRYKPVRTGV
jgi:hypothetical protein